MNVCVTVAFVAAGARAHVNVRAAVRALLRVVHGGVDSNFRDALRRWRGNGVADGEIDGSAAGTDAPASVVGLAGVIDDAEGLNLAGAFAIEQVAGVDAVEEKGIRGVALAVGPNRRVAKAAIAAGPAWQLCVDARRHDGQAGKAAGGQRNRVDLRLIEHVAVGGVNCIQKGRGFDGDRLAHLADLQGGIYRRCAVGLHKNAWVFLRLVSRVDDGYRVVADGQIDQSVDAFCIGGGRARKAGLVL